MLAVWSHEAVHATFGLSRTLPLNQVASGAPRRTISFSGDSTFTLDKPLPPPPGYASWLDYAVTNFDTRQPWLESHFDTWSDENAVELDRQKARESAVLELKELRDAALRPK